MVRILLRLLGALSQEHHLLIKSPSTQLRVLIQVTVIALVVTINSQWIVVLLLFIVAKEPHN